MDYSTQNVVLSQVIDKILIEFLDNVYFIMLSIFLLKLDLTDLRVIFEMISDQLR